MKVLKTVKVEVELEIIEATLLSVEEAVALSWGLRAHEDWWWLRSPGKYQSYAAYVDCSGWADDGGHRVNYDEVCVRPALKLNHSNLEIGDRFTFGRREFEVISDDLAFCLGDIGCCAFRRNRKAKDANVYEFSDVKKHVDEWFKESLA